MEMIGVTCMMTAKGKNARSITRDCANTSASREPPMVAATSASNVMESVTSSEPNRVRQSLIKVATIRLGEGRMTG